ncbi:MAG: hypothetical protein ABSE93_11800 [Terriglobia bacterium]|jgi:hypothetical protein
MTKRNLLVSLFLVLGLVVMTTSAMATEWSVGANVNSSGRSEGLAEAVGQVTVSEVAGGIVNSGSYFTFNYSPALIVSGTVEVSCSGSATFSPASPWASGCVGLAAPAISGTQVSISFNAPETFTTGDGSEIIVTVRVNANVVGPGHAVNCVVTAHPPGGTGPVFSLVNTSTQTVGPVLTVNAFPSLSVGFGTESYTSDTIGKAAAVLTCLGAKTVGNYKDGFAINVAENFPEALTSESYEGTADGGSASPGYVTNGSDFIVTFSNVPAGVGIALEDIWPCSDLDSGNPLQCNTATAYGSLDVYPFAPYSGEGTATASTVSFIFFVTSMDNYGATGMLENVSLSFKIWSHGPLPAGQLPMAVNVQYAPTISSPLLIPYFTGVNELAHGLTVVNFYDCVTNLLFPYINTITTGGTIAFSNFGTGIAIANTTMDPFGLSAANPTVKGSAIPENGSCTLYLYPNDLSGVVAVTTNTIPAGGTTVFDVAAAASYPAFTVAPTAFKNKQGYGIAICDFENAYGYAEIYDNYGITAPPTATLAYLAYIIPNPGLYPRSPAGDGLGASAIAPYSINKMIEKILLYGTRGGGCNSGAKVCE